MKKYLSFGGGVNSVAMMLMLLDQKEDFEAIFVDHETDYPETYEYFKMFQKWLVVNGHQEITVLKPGLFRKKKNITFNNLYDYFYEHKMVPSYMYRICTAEFKVNPIYRYVETPCFMMLGIDSGETKRAKISSHKGVENRFPLLEHEIDREGCKDIIRSHGLLVPIKSGCYICPFQKRQQWIELRRNHPELFCKAVQMEERNKEYRISKGKKPLTLSASKKSLKTIVDENQMNLFEQDDYPSCLCGL